tara:strand:- start:192 stop:497 length:306 start_codon:yes stop_codon:yes gene_type:complete
MSYKESYKPKQTNTRRAKIKHYNLYNTNANRITVPSNTVAHLSNYIEITRESLQEAEKIARSPYSQEMKIHEFKRLIPATSRALKAAANESDNDIDYKGAK